MRRARTRPLVSRSSLTIRVFPETHTVHDSRETGKILSRNNESLQRDVSLGAHLLASLSQTDWVLERKERGAARRVLDAERAAADERCRERQLALESCEVERREHALETETTLNFLI